MSVQENIKNIIDSNKYCLFMKGTQEEPQCGFSAEVVHIMKQFDIDLHTVNVLADWDIREGIKDYSNWPTIPQLYIDGKFIGGCDIIRDMNSKGQLQQTLS